MSVYRRVFLLCLTLLLAVALGCAPTPKSEGTVGYIDDATITTKVKAALLEEPNLNSNDITVETFKGTVQLSGFVDSRAQVNMAVGATRKVNGVKDVRNSLIVKGQQ